MVPMTKNQNSMIDVCRDYIDRGFSVVPLHKNSKIAKIKWADYQVKKPTFNEAELWFSGNENLAIVTGKISGIVVIDIDSIQGKMLFEIKIGMPINKIQTPIAKTPKGWHVYFKHPDNFDVGTSIRFLDGCDLKGNGGYVVAVPSEINGHAYKWINDIRYYSILSLNSISKIYSIIDLLYCNDHAKKMEPAILLDDEESASQNVTRTSQNVTRTSQNVTRFAENVTKRHILNFSKGSRDDSLFTIAATLKKGGMKYDQAIEVIKIIAKSCSPDFPENQAISKIKSAFNNDLPSERNITRELKEWIDVTEGHFSVTECHKDLEYVTKRHKDSVRKILHRFVKEGLLERHPSKNGVFRKVNTDLNLIDWKNADASKVVQIRWPFEIERLVNIFPKNIAIIAGASNSGKTAFLLSTVYRNISRFNIRYLSSEMGPEELKIRLAGFEERPEYWDSVKFYDRSSNFHEVVDPDGLNIVDYLEVTTDFFAVGGEIKKVFDKLNKGIAVIAIQKKKAVELGRGAEFSMEKARLYLSMDYGKLKIVKGKNWAQAGVNPNGREWEFKLVQGCKFIYGNEVSRIEY